MKLYSIVLLTVLMWQSCGTKTPNMQVAPYPTFDKQGHRGCRGLMPENTIAAMLRAVQLGVTTVELDVHITGDAQVVVSHDPWFNPAITTRPDGSYIDTAMPKYLLYQMPYAMIARFDVGLKPHPLFPEQARLPAAKPLLGNLIDSVEAQARQIGKYIFYNIEIKSMPAGDGIYHPMPGPFAEAVMEVIRGKKIDARSVIQSFDVRPLQYLHRRYPHQKLSLLVDAAPKEPLLQQLALLGFVPFVYSPHYTIVTPALVDSCHSLNMKIVPWTVNDLAQMQLLKTMGVDGLISDYPNLFASL